MRINPVALVATVGFAAGLIAWIWSGDWRWAATALVLFVSAAVADGARR